IGRADGNVAAPVANDDAGIGKNGYRIDVQIKTKSLASAEPVNSKPWKPASKDVGRGNHSQQRKQAENQQNLPTRDCGDPPARTADHGTFIELNRAPENDD